MIGWGNVALRNGELHADLDFVQSRPSERAFVRELDAELDRMRGFLTR